MTRPHPLVRLAGPLAFAAALVLWLSPPAARAQVHDNAHLFGAQAVTDADAAIAQMQQKHNKGLVVETFASVPVEQQDAAQKSKPAFFKHWSTERANATRANGVYVMICMDPRYVEVRTGPETLKRGDFVKADADRLSGGLKTDLGANRNDQALSGAVDTVERAYTANIGAGAPAAPSAAGGGVPTPSPTNYPAVPTGSASRSGGFSLGGLICVGVGLLILFAIVKSALGRRNNSGGGFGGGGGGGFSGGTGGFGGGAGNYPTGGPNYGPGYGGPAPRTGGGFGTGFLGGLLGGAVGGYAADKFEHRGDSSSNPGIGGGDSGGSFGGGGNPGFDSGPSDAGQFSDSGGGDSGGDFGGGGSADSGGGGGDSGGGGGDSGGSF